MTIDPKSLPPWAQAQIAAKLLEAEQKKTLNAKERSGKGREAGGGRKRRTAKGGGAGMGGADGAGSGGGKNGADGAGNKLHAQKVRAVLPDGSVQVFDSKREYRRWCELRLMEQAGEISELRTQVQYELIPTQELSDGRRERSVRYAADFVYQKDGKTVVEDAKGFRNTGSAAYRVFVIKRKLMKFIHDIELAEV